VLFDDSGNAHQGDQTGTVTKELRRMSSLGHVLLFARAKIPIRFAHISSLYLKLTLSAQKKYIVFPPEEDTGEATSAISPDMRAKLEGIREAKQAKRGRGSSVMDE